MILMRPVPCVSDNVFYIVSHAFRFSKFAVIRRIKFNQRWFRQWWVWLQVLWYVLFSHFSLYSNYYVGCVSGLRSGVFAKTGVKSKCDICVFVVFVPIWVKSKGGQLKKDKLALKFLVFFSNLTLSFIVISMVWLCLTHSYHCHFTITRTSLM